MLTVGIEDRDLKLEGAWQLKTGTERTRRLEAAKHDAAPDSQTRLQSTSGWKSSAALGSDGVRGFNLGRRDLNGSTGWGGYSLAASGWDGGSLAAAS